MMEALGLYEDKPRVNLTGLDQTLVLLSRAVVDLVSVNGNKYQRDHYEHIYSCQWGLIMILLVLLEK